MIRPLIIFGVLTILVLFSTGGGIYAGIKTGKFEQMLVNPIKNFLSETTKIEPSPVQVTLPVSTITSTPVTTKTPQPIKPQVYTASCVQKNIREGEFASNKCYSEKDYEDLNYYLQRYDSAVFDKKAAEDSMNITCHCRVAQECDFFKASCEKDKAAQATADGDIAKYKSTILGIIAKGK